MAACIDLTGMKFGRLTVIERTKNNRNREMHCGNVNAIAGTKQL